MYYTHSFTPPQFQPCPSSPSDPAKNYQPRSPSTQVVIGVVAAAFLAGRFSVVQQSPDANKTQKPIFKPVVILKRSDEHPCRTQGSLNGSRLQYSGQVTVETVLILWILSGISS